MSALVELMLALLATGGLFTILVIAITNAHSFPRLQLVPTIPSSGAQSSPPCVDVLIPARNEAANIASTVGALVNQDYPKLALKLLDDHSDDGTGQLATLAADGALNFAVLGGQPLPAGWMGKNWACQQLADQAGGNILIFTDADVRWHPNAVSAVVTAMTTLDADLLTVWPTQITESWGERLVVPLMAFAVLGYLPIRVAHDIPHPLAAAANGQCMAFRRDAYAAINGHTGVKSVVVEDIAMAQLIKARGLNLRMADGNNLIRTRMYDGWQATIDGYSKNILAGHGNRVSLLILSTLFHWTLFLWPWAWWLLGRTWALPAWPWWPMALVTAGITARALTARATRQRVGDAIFLPVSVLIMTWIAGRAIWWRWRYGGVKWKGRIIKQVQHE